MSFGDDLNSLTNMDKVVIDGDLFKHLCSLSAAVQGAMMDDYTDMSVLVMEQQLANIKKSNTGKIEIYHNAETEMVN